MNIEELRNYCVKKNHVEECFPFDDETLVFKVMNKIFCLVNLTPPHSANLKCDPLKAIEMREKYEEITPGYHMNKKHWNTIELGGSLRKSLLKELIDDSYNLVLASVPKKFKEKI